MSSQSVLEQDSEPVRLEKSEEEGSSLSPKRRKRQPKQTQISCALLRRQGAEHGVLVDATKPLKTNLPPSFYPIYPTPDTQRLHRYYPMETLAVEH